MRISSNSLKRARMITRGLGRVVVGMLLGGARGASNGHRSAGPGRGEEGGALVEVALTVPVLLAVMTGIITFGIAYSHQLTLTQAVGSAGQYLAQIRTSTTDPCADTFSALKNAAPGLNASNISMTLTMNGTTKTGTSCSGSQSSLVQGSPASVYATYPCSLAVYGIKFTGSCSLAAKVTEYVY